MKKLLLALMFGFAAHANADVITFENGNSGNGSAISASFGSIAGILDVSYSNPTDTSLLTQFKFWSDSYSGSPAAYAGTGDVNSVGFITLTPLNGYQVTLNSFFIGSWPNSDRNTSYTIDNLSTAGVDTSSGAITVNGTVGLLVSSGLSSNSGIKIGFGPTAYNVGINYINFTISAVPEPETYGMFLAGLSLLGLASRRKV